MKMPNKRAGNLVLLVMVIMMVVLVSLIVYLIGDQPDRLDPVYTEFGVVAIDMRNFVYVGEDNQIRVVDWIRHGGRVEVFTSNRTYVMVLPARGMLGDRYKLYLNVSDLQ